MLMFVLTKPKACMRINTCTHVCVHVCVLMLLNWDVALM